MNQDNSLELMYRRNLRSCGYSFTVFKEAE